MIPFRVVSFPIVCALNITLFSIALFFMPFYVCAKVLAKYVFESFIYRAPGHKRGINGRITRIKKIHFFFLSDSLELWFPLFNHLVNVAVIGIGQMAVALAGAAVYHPVCYLLRFLLIAYL
jgi:hypothetical protein